MANEQLTAQNAAQALEADKQQRIKATNKALRALLAEQQTEIIGVPQWVQDGAGGWYTVIALHIIARQIEVEK